MPAYEISQSLLNQVLVVENRTGDIYRSFYATCRALQCPRVHIHKNLVISLMIQCIINIVLFEPYVRLDASDSNEAQTHAMRTTYNEYVSMSLDSLE